MSGHFALVRLVALEDDVDDETTVGFQSVFDPVDVSEFGQTNIFLELPLRHLYCVMKQARHSLPILDLY